MTIRYVASWIETRPDNERGYLNVLFDKYIPPLLDVTKSKFKKITPIPEICHLTMLCNLLNCFLTKENIPPNSPMELSVFTKHYNISKTTYFFSVQYP